MLVTGVTGSGKSTALASMLQLINEQRYANIITIEDPIEFLHRDIKCHINQREVGTDTGSFAQALRRVLRQDPDVILIGEIRDLDTLDTALKAADTGHLVFSTLHTTDATQTINRILSFYPPHQQNEVRFALANALAAVISLRLVPRADKPGRVPACEVLINTAAVREQIRDMSKTLNIPDLIKEGTVQYGMQSFDQSLMSWYSKGTISYENALFFATNPNEFALRVQGVAGSSDTSLGRLPVRRDRVVHAAGPRESQCSRKSSSRIAERSRSASSAPVANWESRRSPSTPKPIASRCTCALPTTTCASARRRRATRT